MNLVSFENIEDLIINHVIDSISLLEVTDFNNFLIADIGTGAGFPGIILAIFQPNNQYYFFEPNKKYYLFLKKVIAELKLMNIQLINNKIENYSEKQKVYFDIITNRAVSDINGIYNICKYYVHQNTILYFFKGEKYVNEINAINFDELKIFFIKKTKILEMHNKNHYIIALTKR